jgi:uncharacterized protein YjbI with pentapeptide repeats
MADQQEIAFDESAVPGSEIEPDESSEEEPEREPDENAEWEGEYGRAGCPIWMDSYGNLGCGRKLHEAPDGADEKPVCLMHSKDPRKQSEPLFDEFWLEFERILEAAGEGAAHFERFVFPELDLSGREFQAICRFDGATFTQDADFSSATFMRDANFSRATFTQIAIFHWTTFTQEADFSSTTFMRKAGFIDASFTQNAIFIFASFTQNAVFIGATFTQIAVFHWTTFTQHANFIGATFTQAANFCDTKFHGTADWCECRFLDQVEFRRTEFDPQIPEEPNAVFVLANFSKPGEVVFDDVDLSRTLFNNCDVSQVWFSSSVRWAKRDGNRGLAVFEETIPLKQEYGRGLRRDGQRDYRALAQIYQQLKKNYDSRLDYWTADEFHFGEMEMKRLAGPTDGPLLWLRQWFHRKLSLVALYRHASDYGNSYTKPGLLLLGILVLFAALFPLPGVGLKRQGARQPETYASVWRAGDGWTPNLWAEARLAGKGAITSVDAATFQKSAEYAPAYPGGRVMGILETLLTSTLFALFLLAIRRQFRR